MKILEVITLGEIGGAQAVLVDLVKGFSSGGFEVEIDVVCGTGEYIPRALAGWFTGGFIQTPFLVRNISLLNDIKAFMQLRQLCKEQKYDLIHFHSSKASWLGRLAAITAGIPRICVTIHGVSFRPGISPIARFLYRNIEKILLPLRTEYIFVSPVDMAAIQSLGVRTEYCKIIPNGRPVPDKPDEGLRSLLQIKGGSPLVCQIGRLSGQKNPLAFIRVAQKVLQEFSNDKIKPTFVMIGDGPLHDECEQALRDLGLTNDVLLMGPIENASQFFWDIDVAVLTSNYEACPLVVIEAMAAGTPVVASDVGGTGDIVKHGETGFLYTENNEDEAAQYIIRLLRDNSLREQMGKQSLKFYRKDFSVERMVKEYAGYFKLTSRRSLNANSG